MAILPVHVFSNKTFRFMGFLRCTCCSSVLRNTLIETGCGKELYVCPLCWKRIGLFVVIYSDTDDFSAKAVLLSAFCACENL